MKVIILFLLFFYSSVVIGQIQLTDTIYKEINKLRMSNYDTIIRFGLPNSFHATNDTLPGIGNFPVLGVEYLIYKKNNKIYSTKLVEHCIEDCDNIMLSISKTLELHNDSLFMWLNKSIEVIRNEEILPYIYQVKTKDRSVVYNILVTSHQPIFFIGICTINDDIGKSINSDFLTEKISNISPTNLNFKYNVGTSLHKLFKKLVNYTSQIDQLYNFK